VSRGLRTLLCLFLMGPLGATEIVWPTSMDRTSLRSFEDYAQPTVSGKPESALFGMVRDDQQRFHEGVDIRPSARGPNGEPLDRVFSAMKGAVAYINQELNGPYGKYVILYHPEAELPVYTLYAHLASIEKTLKVGDKLPKGTAFATMGHTSTSPNAIPKERSHLHFEIGVMLSANFGNWYNAQPDHRGTPNQHGIWNGQNLAGFDPVPVLARSSVNLLDTVRQLPTALAVTMRTKRPPDFVQRYPGLLAPGSDPAKAAGWYVEFTWHGLPKRWTALPPESKQLPKGVWSYVALDHKFRPQLVQRKMITADAKMPSETLIRNVDILLTGTR
jgi:peptidoglycan LD-endopeptidase LytH